MNTDCFADTDNTDVRAEQGAGKKNNHGAHRVIAPQDENCMYLLVFPRLFYGNSEQILRPLMCLK